MRSRSRFVLHLSAWLALAVALSGAISGDATGAPIEPLAITSPNGPALCLPATLSYGAAPTNGSVAATGETDCWRFTGASGDRVRVRVVGTSGALAPRVEIVSPACSATPLPEITCTLGADGTHSIVVRDAAGSQTGDYTIWLQRLDDPMGCSSLTFDAPTRAGAISTGETECWRFTGAAADRVRVRLVTPSGNLDPRAEVLRPDGTTRCGPAAADDQTCTLDAAGTHTILVRDGGAGSGGYSLSVQRLNNPVGCSPKHFTTNAAAGSITLGRRTAGSSSCRMTTR